MQKFLASFFVLLFLCAPALSESLSLEEMLAAEDAEPMMETAPAETTAAVNPAREDMIGRIITTAELLYKKAHGQPQRAQYSTDIYVCKNFSVHCFTQSASDFAMAAYPGVKLVIPNNKKKNDCAPYAYGVEWMDVPAEDGNPFYEVARFRYDPNLSKEENRALARAFMQQAKRGDYFQMSAKYYYGVGAHSMFFIADYDPETDCVHWADSNMKGTTQNGERYAYVQFDAVKEIDWFVDAICQKTRGATIYRLRDDIIYK